MMMRIGSSMSICYRCMTGASKSTPCYSFERLRNAEQYETIGGAAYLAEVGAQVPTAAHAEYYARIVAEKAVLRSLVHAGTDILHDAYDPTSDTRELLSKAEEKVFGILESRTSSEVQEIGEVMQESLDPD